MARKPMRELRVRVPDLLAERIAKLAQADGLPMKLWLRTLLVQVVDRRWQQPLFPQPENEVLTCRKEESKEKPSTS